MLTATQIGAMTVACAILIVVPGPSVMFVVGRALSYGRSNALASVIGNAIGCYLVGVAIAFGLGSFLERSELLFHAIKWAGILYLVWLGIRAIRHAGPIAEADQGQARGEAGWEAIRTGTFVGLTNPKSFVLFTAVVPQFINPAAGKTSMQILLLGIVPMVIGLVTDTSWALLAGRARNWVAGSSHRTTALTRIGGLSIIGVGVSVAASSSRP